MINLDWLHCSDDDKFEMDEHFEPMTTLEIMREADEAMATSPGWKSFETREECECFLKD